MHASQPTRVPADVSERSGVSDVREHAPVCVCVCARAVVREYPCSVRRCQHARAVERCTGSGARLAAGCCAFRATTGSVNPAHASPARHRDRAALRRVALHYANATQRHATPHAARLCYATGLANKRGRPVTPAPVVASLARTCTCTGLHACSHVHVPTCARACAQDGATARARLRVGAVEGAHAHVVVCVCAAACTHLHVRVRARARLHPHVPTRVCARERVCACARLSLC